MVALVDAVASIRSATQEDIRGEVEILREEIKQLEEQIRWRESVIAVLQGLSQGRNGASHLGASHLVVGGNGSSESDGLPKKREVPGYFKTPPSERWRGIHALLMQKGPMGCADIAREVDGTYQTVYTDMKKREGHYFRHLENSQWRALDVELPKKLEE